MSQRNTRWDSISREEIAEAMKRFLEKGGEVEHLNAAMDNPRLNYDSYFDDEWMDLQDLSGFEPVTN